MDLVKFMPYTMRAMNLGIGLIIWFVLIDLDTVASNYFRYFAISSILCLILPFGSNNQLANLRSRDINTLIKTSLGASIACAVLYLFIPGGVFFIIALTLVLFLERTQLAYYIKIKQADKFYKRIVTGRLVALSIILYFIYQDSLTLQIILVCEVLARLFPTPRMAKFTIPHIYWLNTLSGFISGLCVWAPLIWYGDSDPQDLFVARLVIAIQGLSSVFYLTKPALEAEIKYGLTTNKLQLKIITCVLFLCPIIVIFMTVYSITELSAISLFVIYLSVFMWLFSWNGALVINKHSPKRELMLNSLMLLTVIPILMLPVLVQVKVVILTILWHVYVVIIYTYFNKDKERVSQ